MRGTTHQREQIGGVVLARIQEQILTPINMRSDIQRVLENALGSQAGPSPEQGAVILAIHDLQTGLQRWEMILNPALFRSNKQRYELLKKNQAINDQGRTAKTDSAIPTWQIDA